MCGMGKWSKWDNNPQTKDEGSCQSWGWGHNWKVNFRLPNGEAFAVPIWALFWVVMGLFWWTPFVDPIYLVIAIGAALLLGLRLEFSTEEDEKAKRKAKNDETLTDELYEV